MERKKKGSVVDKGLILKSEETRVQMITDTCPLMLKDSFFLFEPRLSHIRT